MQKKLTGPPAALESIRAGNILCIVPRLRMAARKRIVVEHLVTNYEGANPQENRKERAQLLIRMARADFREEIGRFRQIDWSF